MKKKISERNPDFFSLLSQEDRNLFLKKERSLYTEYGINRISEE